MSAIERQIASGWMSASVFVTKFESGSGSQFGTDLVSEFAFDWEFETAFGWKFASELPIASASGSEIEFGTG
jgi:hypothetical protein